MVKNNEERNFQPTKQFNTLKLPTQSPTDFRPSPHFRYFVQDKTMEFSNR